jgi:hypothetical protein
VVLDEVELIFIISEIGFTPQKPNCRRLCRLARRETKPETQSCALSQINVVIDNVRAKQKQGNSRERNLEIKVD